MTGIQRYSGGTDVWCIVLIMMMIGLGGCASSEEEEEVVTETTVTPETPALEGGQPMSFTAHMPLTEEEGKKAAKSGSTRAATRATGDGELTTELLKELGFGVYCWYTGTTYFDPDFTAPKTHIKDFLGTTGYMLMRNQKVEWNSTSLSWGYTPKKYWPLDPDELLTLRAYAPYTDYLVTDAHGMPQLPVLVDKDDYHNGTQHDPLWGTGKHDGTVDADDAETNNEVYGRHYNNYNYQMSGDLLAADNRDGSIDWYFHHGMSMLGFTVSLTPDPGCDNVTITGISISPLYERGLLDLGSATGTKDEKPTWSAWDGSMTVELKEADPNTDAGDLAPIPDPDNPENPHPTNPYPFTIEPNADPSESSDPVALLSNGLLIIPRDFTSRGVTITLTYYVDGDSSNPQTATATINQNFQGNTSYTLGLALTPATNGLEINIVLSAFKPWKTGGAGTHSVYNW